MSANTVQQIGAGSYGKAKAAIQITCMHRARRYSRLGDEPYLTPYHEPKSMNKYVEQRSCIVQFGARIADPRYSNGRFKPIQSYATAVATIHYGETTDRRIII